MALGQIVWPKFIWVILLLSFAPSTLCQTSVLQSENGNSNDFIPTLAGDLRMEDIMHQINRFKRATKSKPGNIIRECSLLRKRYSRRGSGK
uniref:Secreted protein n=1 Tax=Elaeophora elaphi TaxID=1147741 RepID=A0A0R3S6Z8_9BILA